MNEEKILHDEAMDEDNEWAFWFDGKNINEVMFCQYFLQLHPMKCVRGRLFTVDGIVEDEGEISQMILDEVRGCLTNGAYFLNGMFTEDKTYCNNRLKVAYNPNAPQPKRWLHFCPICLYRRTFPPCRSISAIV